MRNCCGDARWAVLALVAVLMALSLISCRHGAVGRHGDNSRHDQLDSVMANIGNVDSLQALVNQSHEQNDAMGEMLALKHQGNKLRESGRFVEAINVHERSLSVADKCRDTVEMATAFYNLGEDYRRLGDLSLANGSYFKVLKLCDGYSDKNSVEMQTAVARALNGIGNIELELNNYTLADSMFRDALHHDLMMGRNQGIAANYGALGRVKRELGDLDSSWYYQRKALEFNVLCNNRKGEALAHLHFGELYEADNCFSHAVEEYTIAYDKLKELGDKWHWLDACLALSHVHILLGEEEIAREYLDQADVEAKRIGSKEYQAEAHLIHYQLSLKQGDSEEALKHYVRSTELRDSIYGRQMSDELRNQHIEFQNHRMTGEVDVLSRDISQLKRFRNIQWMLTLMLLIMAGAIIAALVYAVRVRARTQRLMRQVEETRSLFFTNVVHQLRTPLTAIMGAIDAIMSDGKSADTEQNLYSGKHQEDCEIIERQGNNLLTLVDRILEVGSVRSAITELDWRECDAVAFMHMVLETYRDRCVARHIELTYAPRESIVDIDTVPRYLATIISSLIENAINYGKEFGKITVTSRIDDGMFVIRVADDGLGISKDDLPHVFEPFYRSAAIEGRVEGVGIGLTVVRDMTMALGGVVAVDSMKDCGSVFTVKLPCRHGQGVKQRFDNIIEPLVGRMHRPQRYDKYKSEPNPDIREGLPVVLVVEDHIDVARMVGQALGEDYNVQYATDGEQGLAKAGELHPDLIISDVKMPLMSGLELCRKLRNSQQLCDIPVIMLSARNSDADRVRGIEAGADAYLVKPFVSEELRAWVVRLIENRQMLRDAYAASGRPRTMALPAVVTTVDDSRFLDDFACEVEKQFKAGGKIDLDMVARTFKMGESQLRHKVQTLTGKNVPAYIIQLRMEKAMRLLQSSAPEVLITTISEQCGFQDVAYFSRVFRQHYGMTPSQARKAVK